MLPVSVNLFLVGKDALVLTDFILIDKAFSELRYDNLNIRVENAHLFPDNLIITVIYNVQYIMIYNHLLVYQSSQLGNSD